MTTTILLEPARTDGRIPLDHSRYLLALAAEIAEELPTVAVVVRYGAGRGETLALNHHGGEAELF